MRRYEYDELAPKHLGAMRRSLRSSGLDHDEINDIVSKAIVDFRAKKKFKKCTAAKLKMWLCQATRWGASAYKRKSANRAKYMTRLPEDVADFDFLHVPVTDMMPVTECPFCFSGNLNEYGACKLCHTILPRDISGLKRRVSLAACSLAVTYEYEKQADVAKALARLTPLEQRVVKACIMGNETLEGWAEIEGVSKTSMWRVWAEAKEKLQGYLGDYVRSKARQKPLSTMRRALDAAPVAQI